MNRILIQKRLNELLSVPFQNKGRDPGEGLDCYGLALELWRACGVSIPDISALIDRISDGRSHLDTHFDLVYTPEVGCLVTWTAPSQPVDHVGIYVGGGKVAEATLAAGIIRSNLYGKKARPRFYQPRELTRG